ncbi:MAG: PEP-CTERM sorting domain-containing protein [Phycisphaerales bacterium]|nr:PEP-CTERM sorting domain-containing protein [Phycisphaerales bacterium]
MKNAIALIAVAGIATVASAGGANLSIVASASTIDSTVSTSFTLAVYGDATGTAMAGGEFALTASGGAGIVTDMVGAAAAWGALGQEDLGHGGDGNYNGLIFGQLIFPPFINPAADSMLGNGPVLLGNITVTIAADSAGVIDWSTAAGAGDFILEVFTDDGAAGVFEQLTAVGHGSARVNVVPAPSAMAMLGLGGLVAGRRRR